MKKNNRYLSLLLMIALIASTVFLGGWIAGKTNTAKPDYYFEIEKNIALFGKVYEEVTKRYVEEIDPEEFMKAGINGMLRTLDPYTMYIEREGNAELKLMTTGKYGGVGMRIAKRDGWATVIEPPFEGTPSKRAGIREGDKIIEVDGKSTKDLSISETAERLRGEIGTEVNVKIRRVGEDDPLEFRLIRAEIEISDISYAGFVDDKVGYIRLGHFSRYAGKQVHDAIVELKKQGMESLIFDLRSNPGGLLESAVQVAENFVHKGDLIVYTKGRISGSDKEFHSRVEPVWGEKPLIVLVDQYSASASEIVSGAVQDLDRGVIIGKPTYGKGLVQTVIPLTRDGNSLKITSAKYYVPSGRLIQKPDFIRSKDIMWNYEESQDTTKKEEKTFHTASNREVKGNGGITPDIEVEQEKMTPLMGNLIMKSMFFNFALNYAVDHENLERNFEVSDQMVEQFKTFLESKDFTYKNEVEQHIEDLEKVLTENEYPENVIKEFEDFKKSVEIAKQDDFAKNLTQIKQELKMEIAAKLWGTAGKYESQFSWDPAIEKSLDLLMNQTEYYTLLGENTNEK